MKKFMSLLLSVLLVLSLVPMTAMAAEETWNSFIYYQDGAVFSVEATEFEGSKDSYDFYAAGYDSEGKLLEIKKDEAAVVDGTLEGEVSFETIVNGAVTKEANPAIKTVKTMVWDGMTPIVRAGEFTNIDDTGLTNGFYEPVLSGKVASETRYGWRDNDNNGTIDSYLGSWPDSNKHDGDLNTKNGNYGPINNASAFASGELAVAQYITELTESVEIDRVVVYYDVMSTPDNEMRFYLAKSLGAQSGKDTYLADFNETTHGDITYLGYRGTNAGVVTDGVAKLVFEADGAAYKYLVADMNKNSDYGYVYEWQAYKKRPVRTDEVDAFTIDVNYNGLSYSQDGPVFTVNAQEFSTNATELYLVATAFAGADATGEELARVSEPVEKAATLTKSVNLEKYGEVNPLMASVKVEVVDSLGNNVLPAWTKNVTPQTVTDDVYSNFTNGFYEPVVDGDTSIAITKMYRYTNENKYTNEYANASVADGKLSTRNIYNQTADGGSNTGIYWQDAVSFSTATKIDRIVAYPVSSNGVRFYLTPAAIDTSGLMQPHFGACVPETTSYYYVGDNTTAKSVTSVTVGSNTMNRFVLDTNGGTYRAMIVDYRTGSSSGNYDLQAYRKVQDEYEVSPHIVPTYEVAEDAAAFAYGSAEGTTPAMAVDGDPATAWISNNESDYRDQLILDLGTAYTIDSLKITMAEGSDQDFVVYGMNTALNNERNTAITRNVSATEFDRTALTETITGLTAGENTVTTNGTETAFRYLVFEQDPENETNPAFGFADIKVYTTDAAGAAPAATGAVTKIEGTTVAVMERLYSNNDIWSSTPVAGADNILDSDPRTVGSPANVSIGWNSCSGHIAMLDLGTAQKVSQVVYQGVSSGVSYPYETQYFMVIASNDKPVGVTFENGAVTAIDSRIDILGRFDAGTNTAIVEDPGHNAGNYETGLLVFDVPEEFANKEYKYIGIMKIDNTGDSGTTIRTRIGTLQAYTAAQ